MILLTPNPERETRKRHRHFSIGKTLLGRIKPLNLPSETISTSKELRRRRFGICRKSHKQSKLSYQKTNFSHEPLKIISSENRHVKSQFSSQKPSIKSESSRTTPIKTSITMNLQKIFRNSGGSQIPLKNCQQINLFRVKLLKIGKRYASRRNSNNKASYCLLIRIPIPQGTQSPRDEAIQWSSGHRRARARGGDEGDWWRYEAVAIETGRLPVAVRSF